MSSRKVLRTNEKRSEGEKNQQCERSRERAEECLVNEKEQNRNTNGGNGATATETEKEQTSAVLAHLFSEVWKKKQSCILEVWQHQMTVREKVWGLVCV